MTFTVKMDDKKIKVDISSTWLQDVLKYCKPKEQLVLLKKYWLNWQPWIPLQRIWQDYWLTRERVRQIESQWLMRFRRLIVWNDKYIKLIWEAKKILDMNWGFLSEEDLVSKIINKWIFNFSAEEVRLVLVSDFDVYYLKRNKAINKSFYLEPLFEDLLTKIANYSVSYFEKNKSSEDMYDFIDKLKADFAKKYPDVKYLENNVFYINFFKGVKGISVFDWKIWLDTFIEVNPKTIKQKVIYILRRVNKPLHYQEIASKIMEWFDWKPVKINTVHNELVKNSDIFINMGLGIYWLKEWGYQWGTVKEIIERILSSFQRPMSIKEITQEVLKEKMVSPNTIVLTLQKYQELFQRVSKWTYQIKK